MVALPMSFLITFVAMWALGYSINNLTLMALTLAIGFLVDDAIVFLENVVRRAEAGESIYRATLNSAGEISFTILSMTLSLAAVFIPLAFMPGLLGRIFREFAITIIVAILASGLVSLTLTPLMCSRILAERGAGHRETWTERFREQLFHPNPRLLRAHSRLVSRSRLARAPDRDRLRSRRLVLLQTTALYSAARPATAASIRGFFIVQEGASPDQQRRLQDKLDPILQANPAVDKYFTVAGRAGLSARVFSPFCFLKDREQRARYRDGRGASCARRASEIPGIFPTLQSATGSADQRRSDWQLLRSLHLCLERNQSRRGLRRRRQARSRSSKIMTVSPVRRVPIFSAIPPISTSTSSADAPGFTASRRPRSKACSAPPIRRTTST